MTSKLTAKQARADQIAALLLEDEKAEIPALQAIRDAMTTVGVLKAIAVLEENGPLLNGNRASQFAAVLQNMKAAAAVAQQDVDNLLLSHQQTAAAAESAARLAKQHETPAL